jgi:DnaK suppressor protein
VNTEEYKPILLANEKELVERIELAMEGAREQTEEGAIETGDRSVTDQEEEKQFTEAELDTEMLKQVRDALQRIEDGTFGACIVDGEPIEEKRLKAIPWTPYCLLHQQELESSPLHTSTL